MPRPIDAAVDYIRPREVEALGILVKHGPMQRAEVAKHMGCSPLTAGQHLWCCKRAGKAHSIGAGCKAVWHPGPGQGSGGQKVSAAEVQHHLASVWR